MDRQLLDIPNLEFISIDHRLALEASRIRRKYGFRLPDSIYLATAIFGKADAFVTNEEKLKKFKDLKIILLKDI